MGDLASRTCAPCNARTPRLDEVDVRRQLDHLPGWQLAGGRLRRRFEFADFASALAFTVHVGALAEAEGHHPDLRLGWGYVEAELHTHAIGGLSENDLVLAAKINRLEGPAPGSPRGG